MAFNIQLSKSSVSNTVKPEDVLPFIPNDFVLGDDFDPTICTEPDNDKPWRGWRHLDPSTDYDMSIISSYGGTHPQHVRVAEKLVPPDCSTDRLVLAREELDCLLDLFKQCRQSHLVYCYAEHSCKVQMSRDYYLQRIKKFLIESEREWAVLHYTGDSEEGSGNWCFQNGVITFQDIYDIYIECFKGKRLTIISDCSYSGNWVKDCVKVYDSQGIPACGHHTRENGVLLNVLGSCKSFQQATILGFVREAMEVIVDEVIYTYNRVISSGQITTAGTFYSIYCDSRPDEQCQYSAGPPHTWENEILLSNRVHLIHGKNEGKPAWWYVLVDEEKEQTFLDKLKTGSVDVHEYGKVLYSGWGKEPSQDIKVKIKDQFSI